MDQNPQNLWNTNYKTPSRQQEKMEVILSLVMTFEIKHWKHNLWWGKLISWMWLKLITSALQKKKEEETKSHKLGERI